MSSNSPAPEPTMPPILEILPGLAPLANLIPNPAIAILAQLLLAYGPKTYISFAKLFYNPKATLEDVIGVLKEIDAESYDQFIEEAKAAAGAQP